MSEMFRPESATHTVVDVLLPWFVNGTLEGEERALVERHLDHCHHCRREADWLRELHAAHLLGEAPRAVPAPNPQEARP